MTELNYYLLDVFTDTPFGGNPLAVFPHGDDISTASMQKIANELNLSETTFIQSAKTPESDCTVRIFTPLRELPMAGHPTIGTAYTILKHGLLQPKNKDSLLFDEGVGPIRVDFKSTKPEPMGLMMHQPLPEFSDTLDKGTIAKLLSLKPQDIDSDLPVQIVSCGVPYIVVPLSSLEAIKRASLQLNLADAKLSGIECREFFLFTEETEFPESDLHCRMFAPRFGVPEDPATGSAHGPLGSYLYQHGRWKGEQMTSEQGIELGRPSKITFDIVSKDKAIVDVQVGGNTVEIGNGILRIQDL